jgi:hypothetical protein
MRRSILFGLYLVTLALAGCSTTQLPICPKMAQLSYDTTDAGKDKIIGRFLADQAARRGIKIKPLSYSVAEFSGPTWQIKWLRANYPVLLCSVNPKLVDSPEHLADLQRMVMLHAREWMRLVDEGNAAALATFNSNNVYLPCCASDD